MGQKTFNLFPRKSSQRRTLQSRPGRTFSNQVGTSHGLGIKYPPPVGSVLLNRQQLKGPKTFNSFLRKGSQQRAHQSRPDGIFSNQVGTNIWGGHHIPSGWNRVNASAKSKWGKIPTVLIFSTGTGEQYNLIPSLGFIVFSEV